MRHKIWYSTQNGGDGSAYPRLVECKELGTLMQENDDEGWAEDCSGSIEIECEGPFKIIDSVWTVDNEIKEQEENLEYSSYKEVLQKYIDQLKDLKRDRDQLRLFDGG